MEKTAFNKSNIAILFLVLLSTVANIWLHRNSPPPNWETIEQYGISFRHPSGYRFASNTPTDWIPSYWEGGLQGEPITGDLEIIGIYWLTDKASNTEEAIEYILALAKTENPGLSSQDISKSKISAMEIDYCLVELETDGVKIPGILCAFIDPYGRIILTYHLRYLGSYEYSKKMIETIIRSIDFSPISKPRS